MSTSRDRKNLAGFRTAIRANLPASMKKYYPLDLSASKICLHLSGGQSGQLINRQSAIDLSRPDGQFMATSAHHVGVHILKMGAESYLLFLPSSLLNLAHGLFDIACQFGVQIAKTLTWPENSLKIADNESEGLMLFSVFSGRKTPARKCKTGRGSEKPVKTEERPLQAVLNQGYELMEMHGCQAGKSF